MSPPPVERRMQTVDEEMIEEIAERAAEKAVEKITSRFYMEVGKSVMQKLYVIVGSLAVGLFFIGQTKGWWK